MFSKVILLAMQYSYQSKICQLGLIVNFFPPNDEKMGLYSTNSRKDRCQSSCKCTQCWKSINYMPPSMLKMCFVIEFINDALCLFLTLMCIWSCLNSSIIFTISYSLIDTSKHCLCNRTIWEDSKGHVWISSWGFTGGKLLVGPFCAFWLATILVNPSIL